MSRRLLFLSVLWSAALLAAACGGSGSEKVTSSIAFDAERAMRDIDALSTRIGPRPTGSAAAAEAATYIADEFGRSHFGVIRSNFTVELSPNRAATVTFAGATIAAITAGGSGGGAVTGMASTLPGDAGPNALNGKVAISFRGGATFQETYDKAKTAGAVGLVIVNSEPGPVTANLTGPAAFPVVTVAGEDGPIVRAAAAAGRDATISVTPPETVSATNLIARPISAHSCIYAVVANYDSLPGSAGANDNASGIAILLEIARQFGAMPSPPEVCFIAFDGRFTGGAGSDYYLNAAREAGRPAVIIAVSRAGTGDRLAIYGEQTLRGEAARIARVLGTKFTDAGSGALTGSDSTVFSGASISTLDITRGGNSTGRDDASEPIDLKLLREAGTLIGEVALGVSAKAGR